MDEAAGTMAMKLDAHEEERDESKTEVGICIDVTSIQVRSRLGDAEQWWPEVETHKSGIAGEWARNRAVRPALVVAGRRIEQRPATGAAELRLNWRPAGL
jgi:hypothetical protein